MIMEAKNFLLSSEEINIPTLDFDNNCLGPLWEANADAVDTLTETFPISDDLRALIEDKKRLKIEGDFSSSDYYSNHDFQDVLLPLHNTLLGLIQSARDSVNDVIMSLSSIPNQAHLIRDSIDRTNTIRMESASDEDYTPPQIPIESYASLSKEMFLYMGRNVEFQKAYNLLMIKYRTAFGKLIKLPLSFSCYLVKYRPEIAKILERESFQEAWMESLLNNKAPEEAY